MRLTDPGLLSLVAALRAPQDEVRLNTALAAACTADPANGAALARAALRHALIHDTPSPRASALLERIPDGLRCSDQVSTSVLTVGRGRKLAERGVIDLVLRDMNGFSLAFELKIGVRRYDNGQIARYLASGLPVIGLVPKRSGHPEPVTEHPGWMGEACWSELMSTLAGFNLPAQAQPVWQALLEVLAIDGDLGAPPLPLARRGHERQDARRALETIRDQTGVTTSLPVWEEALSIWVLTIPYQKHPDPPGLVALDVTAVMPFAVVAGVFPGGVPRDLVEQLGVVGDLGDGFVRVALSFAEQERVADLVPELLVPIVRRFMAAGGFATQ